MAADYIKFPTTLEERNQVKIRFMDKFNFPGVIGAIDCTHIAILKPRGDEHNFINRKGFHSLNCQLICDDNLLINNVFANYGGSTHDSFVWRHSAVKEYMQQLYDNRESCWLIGDSGYPLQPFLVVPFHNPLEGSPQQRFNYAHIRARNCVERCIGVLKMRFRCLMRERSLRYTPNFVSSLLKACAILHNSCVKERVPLLNEDIHDHPQLMDFDVAPAPPANEPGELAARGLQVRNIIIDQYYQ